MLHILCIILILSNISLIKKLYNKQIASIIKPPFDKYISIGGY